MQNKDVLYYLQLLEDFTRTFEQLGLLQEEKIAKVKADDLLGLNDCIRREQALSLQIRGYDKRRLDFLEAQQIQTLPLLDFHTQVPEDLRFQTKQVCDALRQTYAVFRGRFDAAQTILESNLYQVEQLLQQHGGQVKAPERPKAFRTDFRA